MRPADIAILLAAAGLAGCASQAKPPPPEPRVAVVTAHDAVAVSCVPADAPNRPDFADTVAALLAADGPTQFQLLAAEYARHEVYESQLETIVNGCRGPK